MKRLVEQSRGTDCAAGKPAPARTESSPTQTEGGCGTGSDAPPQPRFQITREDLRNAPSGMVQLTESWRRKAAGE